MSKTEISGFAGILPSKNSAVIPQATAQIAENCILWHGDLRSLKAPYPIVTPPIGSGVMKSIYRIGQGLPEIQYWMHWTDDVDVVRGMINGDVSERTLFTGNGVPKATTLQMATQGGIYYPVNSYMLGVITPTQKPILSASSTTAPVEGRAYLYTYVNTWGEEGSPSPAATVDVSETGTVEISGMATAPIGNYAIAYKRIYRSQNGSSGNGAYLFVAEIPDSQTTFTDDILSKNLSEPLATLNFVPPPADMRGLIAMPNGMMAGFSGQDVCFCEPYTPYAWLPEYQLTTDYPIVGLGVFGSSLVVCTTGVPYLVSGVHPSAMTMEKIEVEQACVSKRSIVSFGSGVMYASPDGLVYVGTGGTKIATLGLFSRDEWQALSPSTLSGYYYDGKYIGVFSGGGGFILNSQEDNSFTTFDDMVTAGYSDRITGSLYLAVNNVICKFNAGTPKTYRWKSKQFQFLAAASPSTARVDADSYPVTFKLYSDGVLRYTYQVPDEHSFRLPSGYRPRQLEIEVTGDKPVRLVGIANSPSELKIG